ncbi:hypothetical protein, partial [Cypionkella sp.]|uniref:hypothetical protein n=1 Tax=Cypionkella sp. TaxID=2811411 RepID=UPI002ABC5079
VTLIPASGEFTYATDAIRKGSGGATVAENLNALPDQPDIVVALDRLPSSFRASRCETASGWSGPWI